MCRLVRCSLSPEAVGMVAFHSGFLEYVFQNKHLKMDEEKKAVVPVAAMVKEGLRQNMISVFLQKEISVFITVSMDCSL